VLKGLQWPLWLPGACYNEGCIHRLANPHKVPVHKYQPQSGQCDCTPWVKSDIYDCLVSTVFATSCIFLCRILELLLSLILWIVNNNFTLLWGVIFCATLLSLLT